MFYVNIDVADLLDVAGLPAAAKKAMDQAAMNLTKMTQGHIAEEAAKKLHTRRGMFIEALSSFQENEFTWVVNLDASARWIDEGMPEHNMLDDLLKSKKAKRAKDGSTYVVIPFEHNKGPTEMTPAQTTLLNTIKAELKKRDIPYGKIENDAAGKPKTGILHSFDISKQPLKAFDGPGQGAGPVGQVMQGPTGIPLLQGVQVTQKKVKDKAGKESVKRMIMTFRVASSKHREQSGRWDYPGVEPTNLMEEGMKWALDQWNSKVAEQVMASVIAELA